MVTAAMKLKDAYSLEEKLWMTNLDSILKSRDITLPTKVHLVIAMVFPVVTYRCESWTIRKPERQRTDAFELWCWRRLLRVPWTARRSNESILKEISPEYSLEGLMLKHIMVPWKLTHRLSSFFLSRKQNALLHLFIYSFWVAYWFSSIHSSAN